MITSTRALNLGALWENKAAQNFYIYPLFCLKLHYHQLGALLSERPYMKNSNSVTYDYPVDPLPFAGGRGCMWFCCDVWEPKLNMVIGCKKVAYNETSRSIDSISSFNLIFGVGLVESTTRWKIDIPTKVLCFWPLHEKLKGIW